MDKILVVVFDNESKAYEGSRPFRLCRMKEASISTRRL